jgi:hypothetical protein
MKADVDVPVAVEGIPWIGAAGVCASRAAETTWVLRIKEPIVSLGVFAQLRVILVRTECQWRTTLPAAHHLGAEANLLGPACGVGP